VSELLSELEGLQRKLEHLHARCEQSILKPGEIQESLGLIDSHILELLQPGSDLFRLWDRHKRSHTDWWHETLSGYADRQDCGNIGYRITGVQRLLAAIEPDFLRADREPPSELYFQAGEVFRARQGLYRLLKRASSKVQLADPYLDADVFDFIEAIDAKIDWELLVGSPKRLLVRQLQALTATRSNVAARSNSLNHDRFLILDQGIIWHLGASVNGLGKKGEHAQRRRRRTTGEQDRC
jgi:hypothetical protein